MEEKHGQWITDTRDVEKHSFICSVCGEGRHSFDNEMECKEHPKICPNCGAVMTDFIKPDEDESRKPRHKYYLSISSDGGSTSGYMDLSSDEYQIICKVMDIRNWYGLKFTPESGHFFISPEME